MNSQPIQVPDAAAAGRDEAVGPVRSWVRSWVGVGSFIVNPAVSDGPDQLLAVLAFYLMVGYVLLGQWGTRQTFLARLLGSRDTFLLGPRRPGRQPSHAANFALRLLQVHFAF